MNAVTRPMGACHLNILDFPDESCLDINHLEHLDNRYLLLEWTLAQLFFKVIIRKPCTFSKNLSQWRTEFTACVNTQISGSFDGIILASTQKEKFRPTQCLSCASSLMLTVIWNFQLCDFKLQFRLNIHFRAMRFFATKLLLINNININVYLPVLLG